MPPRRGWNCLLPRPADPGPRRSPLEQLVAADLAARRQRPAAPTAASSCAARATQRWPPWPSTCPTGGRPAPTGGLNLWCELPAALSTALVSRAERHGVLLAAGPSFAPEGGLDRFVRLPYTQPAHVLTDAIGRLGQAWQETVADPGFIARSAPTLVA